MFDEIFSQMGGNFTDSKGLSLNENRNKSGAGSGLYDSILNTSNLNSNNNKQNELDITSSDLITTMAARLATLESNELQYKENLQKKESIIVELRRQLINLRNVIKNIFIESYVFTHLFNGFVFVKIF